MKFTTIAILSIVGSAIANPIVQEDAPTFADGPVSIGVTCDGNVVWTKLSLLELTTAGKVLVESYNTVHDLASNDDSQLRDIVFAGNIKSTMHDDEEDQGKEGTHLDGWFKPRPSKGFWSGNWGCTECPDDSPDVRGPILKSWQNEFVAGLLESKIPVFQSIRSCMIDMLPGEDTLIDMPNADIEIDCGRHFDLTLLTVSMGAYLSHALQTSYNKVHALNANDDSALTNVYYFKKSKKNMLSSASSSLSSSDPDTVGGRFSYGPGNPYIPYQPKGVAAPGLSGWWGCRLCPSDDDVMLTAAAGENRTIAMQRHAHQLTAATTGPLLQAWEAELNVALQNGPFAVLKKIEWCDLKLVPHKKFFLGEEEEEEEEEVEDVPVDDRGCGLRGGCKGDGVSME